VPGGALARAGGLLRACHPEPTAAVVTLATLLAVASGRSAAGCVAVAAAVLAGQVSIGWANDWVDVARDRAVGRADKPVAAGLVSVPVVRACALTALALTVPLSFLSGWRAGLAHTAAVALAWAYDLAWKASPLSVVAYAGAFALLPTFVTLGLPGHPLPAWQVPVAGALLGAGAHLVNVLPDLADDLRLGVRGLPQRLGPTWSRAGAALLLLAASVVLASGPGRVGALQVAGLAVAVCLVAVGLARAARPGSPTAFRAAMALALLDVVLLLARGSSLA